jgi:transcriptional regulator
MSSGKIDKVKLSQMLQSGKAQRECAKVFGVTEAAISQVKKELNVNVIKSVALENIVDPEIWTV